MNVDKTVRRYTKVRDAEAFREALKPIWAKINDRIDRLHSEDEEVRQVGWEELWG